MTPREQPEKLTSALIDELRELIANHEELYSDPFPTRPPHQTATLLECLRRSVWSLETDERRVQAFMELQELKKLEKHWFKFKEDFVVRAELRRDDVALLNAVHSGLGHIFEVGRTKLMTEPGVRLENRLMEREGYTCPIAGRAIWQPCEEWLWNICIDVDEKDVLSQYLPNYCYGSGRLLYAKLGRDEFLRVARRECVQAMQELDRAFEKASTTYVNGERYSRITTEQEKEEDWEIIQDLRVRLLEDWKDKQDRLCERVIRENLEEQS